MRVTTVSRLVKAAVIVGTMMVLIGSAGFILFASACFDCDEAGWAYWIAVFGVALVVLSKIAGYLVRLLRHRQDTED